MKINVTKPFIPDYKDYEKFVKKIWQSSILTNQGPLVNELQFKMKDFLNVENFLFVSNGTIALQIAINSLNICSGEIITTPFSYVATMSSILWERCTPIFVDIEKDNFTIDHKAIEDAITENTKAIMGVHVFGYPCAVEKIESIAKKYNLYVIYDAAHAFGVRYKGKSLISYGDISTLSFHATKLFHTVEGGGVAVSDNKIFEKLELIHRFGHNGNDHIQLGINAKNSEFHAAMGLAIFPYFEKIVNERKKISELYDELLIGLVLRPATIDELEYNYSYYPVLFKNENELIKVFKALEKEEIYPRRYFYPSLNKIKYVNSATNCLVSENIASRVACLPLFVGLEEKKIRQICQIIKNNL